LRRFGLVALATFGCHIAYHGMLAVSLAAIFCLLDTFRTLLEAGKASPD